MTGNTTGNQQNIKL